MTCGGGFTNGCGTTYLQDANNKKNVLTLSKEYFGQVTQKVGCDLKLPLIILLILLIIGLIWVCKKK